MKGNKIRSKYCGARVTRTARGNGLKSRGSFLILIFTAGIAIRTMGAVEKKQNN